MSKKERDLILESIEDEFRQDLAVHLYSTHLLHAINPYFPRRNWSNWPLPYSEVPDPRNLFTYSDQPIAIYNDDESQTRRYLRHSGPRGVSEPSEDVSKYRIRSFSTTQKRSDSRTSLMAEIKALVDHRIHSVIHARNSDGVPSSEISSAVVGKLCIEIANNLDDVLESMADIVERRNLSSDKSAAPVRLLNWQDVLLCASNTREISPDLHGRCESLFEDTNYSYEYESDFEERIENDSDELSDQEMNEIEEASSQNSETSSSNSETSSSDSETSSSDSPNSPNSPTDCPSVSGSQSFISFHQQHLERLRNMEAVPAYYKRLAKIEKKRQVEKQFFETKKKLFLNHQNIRKTYASLKWDRAVEKKSQYRIEGENSEETRRLAIEHGGVGITPDDYLE
ncbi:hypothetical protein PGUG_01425 [Meyerozyma guilliermondii ATCC 6260]|uniref:Rrn9 domain-containing protein n=1 Tax=Meyerozyma guilliermondii (strain ATCC 6260 / CBS 566 / DSM 6381 / JCM 1539 / NBRC 10279 / NRRL Y-324) TaxID=294746 RepID=A5DDS4_PICGU|nr:uncharacterized protein PGUG_01425 [Meyerozyma guilliermondii ATCC 6260]EDK37327.2 hypothetical protein PGUG_01425 [Meyerozyma guilliermondii ATCC 6260]